MQQLQAKDGSSAALKGEEILELRDPAGRLIVEYDTRQGKAILYLPQAQLQVRSVGGKVEFASDQAMKFTTRETLELEAERGVLVNGPLDLRCPRVEAHVDDLDWRGDRITARAGEVQVAWGRLEQVAGRVLTFAKSVYERVEGLLHSRAGRVRSESKGAYLVQADHAEIAAQDDVKIHGKTINLG